MTLQPRVERLEALVDQHNRYRDNCLNLIASENVPSPFVERMLTAELDRLKIIDPETYTTVVGAFLGIARGAADDASRRGVAV